MSDEQVKAHYNAVAETYHQQYQQENLTTSKEYPANYFRLQILLQRMAHAQVQSVYEVGVGEGTPLAHMASMGLRVAGCDISEGMVKKARENFQARGLSADFIQWGDVEDAATFSNQRVTGGAFDAAVAAGVLPHVKNDRLALDNIGMMVRSGGRVFVEFRNKLFSLFTFNRYTKEFILDDLLHGVSPSVKDAVSKELDRRVAIDLPPVRSVIEGKTAPGYDVIPSKFHNPFELVDMFKHSGFSDVQIHWYHYHPAFPMLEEKLGKEFREAAMALEHEKTWRGYFLCSAGIIEAVKA